MIWKKWFKKPQHTAPDTRYRHFISFLKSRLSSPSAAASILYEVKDFEQMAADRQEAHIVRIYLLFEHYCCEVDPISQVSPDFFRQQILEIFPWVKNHPYLRLAFAEPQQAKAHMVAYFFKEIADPVLEIAGNKGSNFFKDFSIWLHQIWEGSFKVLRLPDNQKTINPLVNEDLKALSRFVFTEFSNHFGTLNTEKLFNKAFNNTSSILRDHRHYNVIIDIMPHQLLTLEHLRILGRSQMQRIMLEQVEELKELNENLQIEVKEKSNLYNRLTKRADDLTNIFENAFDAVVCINGYGIVTAWNKKAHEIFQYAPSEAIGKPLHKLIVPEYHIENHKHGLERFISTRRSKVVNKNIEIEGMRKDGSIFPIELCISDVSEGGEALFCGFIRDISNRKISEKRLIKAKDVAEENAQFQTQFMARMSHEIRTPLNAIIGFSELLSQKELDTESAEFIQLINSSGTNLMQLLNDVLEFSKLEQGNINLHLEARNFKQEIKNTLAPYIALAQQKGLEFELIFEEAFPTFIVTDYHRLAQVLLNLTGNALKFTEQGKIRVRFGYEFQDEGFSIHTRVCDTGKGIAPEKLELIFEPFRQENGKISSNFGGTGLGLSICKDVTHALGGDIKAFSPGTLDKQHGTDFVFYITATIAENISEIPDSTDTAPLFQDQSAKNILVVEDNLLNQQLIKKVLENENLNTTICPNAEEAIELLQQQTFHLIFMDVQLPGMSGIEASQKLMHDMQLKTPIIALSANVSPEDRAQSKAAGMVDHMGKPFRQAELKALIRKYVPSSAP